MLHEGPIIIIDDNDTDQDLFIRALSGLDYPNDVVIITESTEVIHFLKELAISPVMILSHIMQPVSSAFALRKELLEIPNVLSKDIPYIYYCDSSEDMVIRQAYASKADGFFLKPDNVQELMRVLAIIINYWGCALHP